MMKYSGILCIAVIASIAMIGCSGGGVSSQEAIEKAKALQVTASEKAEFLVGEAKSMYNSKQFQDAVSTVQYALQHFDKNSAEAKALLDKAKKALVDAGEKAVDEAKKKFSL